MLTREQLETLDKEALIDLILKLAARVSELQARQGKNSKNSSKPPRQDSVFEPKAKKPSTGSTGRKSGGQPGHRGQGLCKVEKPDHFAVHTCDSCPGCGYDLREQPGTPAGCWQVFDLPADLRLVVTQHQRQQKTCPWCDQQNVAAVPDWLSQNTPCQYGPRCRALGVYLMQQQHLPFERTQAVFVDLFGSAASEGTLWNWQQQAYDVLAPVEAAIAEAVVGSPMVGADETPVNGIGGIHVLGNESWTWYGAPEKRGREAMEFFGLLPRYHGILMSECLSSYDIYGGERALCNSHLLRELRALEEAGHFWASWMARLLVSVKEQVHSSGAPLARSSLGSVFCWFGRCLSAGGRENAVASVVESRRLMARLRARRDAYLRFATMPGAWFDNNVSERALRMVKLHQKISGCFRSFLGGQILCRVRGYLSTMAKQKQGLFSALVCVMQKRPILPPLLQSAN
jgi:transposase